MKIALFSSLLLACSAFAAPVAQLHTRLETLEVTIVDVMTDITQGGSEMQSRYHSGITQFKWLIKNLPGHKYPCSPLPSVQARSEEHTAQLLTHSRRGIRRVVQVLAESSSPTDAWVRGDICSAYDHYRAAHPYIKSL